jgi:hypothetical protein
MTAQLAPGYDPRHWTTTDGRRHISVPAPEPLVWTRMTNDAGRLVYVSGSYSIVRVGYGLTGACFHVHRDGIELPLAFYARLWLAKERAVVNAQGGDTVNHA